MRLSASRPRKDRRAASSHDIAEPATSLDQVIHAGACQLRAQGAHQDFDDRVGRHAVTFVGELMKMTTRLST